MREKLIMIKSADKRREDNVDIIIYPSDTIHPVLQQLWQLNYWNCNQRTLKDNCNYIVQSAE